MVSEIGEQWSPHTAPAIQAEMDNIIILWSIPEKILTTIGISIPKVHHEVPVANARNAAIKNIITGIKWNAPDGTPLTIEATHSLAPRLSVIAFSVHASVNISIAGTIALNPSGIQLMESVNFNTLRIW